MALPPMTAEQRQESLNKAKAARAARARALAEVKTGSITLTAVLDDEQSPLQRAPVRRVLLAVPGIGVKKADQIMAGIGIDAKRRIRGLGPRQRALLAAALS